MLELRNIRKEYLAGDGKVVALKGIDLQFRQSEFVSILGPSGCGKTTMLNIIGGLDQYTDGDLIINGKSTRDFKDRDWDTYRNHSIGFVFQSYNLIPHQTVLQNVELALTLSGVSKAERRKRAKQALEEVGLGDQFDKRPNQMSGGQMQRVAIARALVNNPDIILADEPTGALDTETSVQVMEILKEISKDRLIIMVTHNPELAGKYSSRIINMLDGVITHDSAPLSEAEIQEEVRHDSQKQIAAKNAKKPSMSFGTSFMLSLKNLFTKKGRTTLTAFAGSIGIIGIALIFAVSQGMTSYIDLVQEDALSSYPMTIETTSVNLLSLMNTFMNIRTEGGDHEQDAVYKKAAVTDIINTINSLEDTENDLTAFKAYLESEVAKEDSDLANAINGIQYAYNLDMLVYTKSVDGTILRSDAEELLMDLIVEYMGMDMDVSTLSSLTDSSPMSSIGSMGSMSLNLWQELLPGNDGKPINDLLTRQYDVVYGSWPNSYDEIVLVVDENNELDDVTLYALGLLPKEDIDAIMESAVNGTELEETTAKWSYEDICGMELRTILNADCYSYDEEAGRYADLRGTQAGLRYLYDTGLSLKVTGIIRPNDSTGAHMLSGTIGYTSDLTKYLLEKAKDSEVISAQMDDPAMDVLTGLPFQTNAGNLTDEEKAAELRDYIKGLDEEEKAAAYIQIKSIPAEEFLQEQANATVGSMSRAEMEAMILEGMAEQMTISPEQITSYLASMGDDELHEIFMQMAIEQIQMQYAEQVKTQMAALSSQELAYAMDKELAQYTAGQCAAYYDEIMEFSDSTYEDNLVKMGFIELDDPSAINIYASTFENKDVINDAIAAYNETVDEMQKISYTDYVGLMMSSVTSIIEAITYVLVSFVAISLIVSSIMIGVITLISVQERTKEIGILRAIGASKHDVSSMFNAETMIIGFASGALGVLVTYLLCIPINLVLHHLTGISTLNAFLPLPVAVILVVISVLLTLISGIIPSRSAAKKDPVVALRTE